MGDLPGSFLAAAAKSLVIISHPPTLTVSPVVTINWRTGCGALRMFRMSFAGSMLSPILHTRESPAPLEGAEYHTLAATDWRTT